MSKKLSVDSLRNTALDLRATRNALKVLKKKEEELAGILKSNLPYGTTDFGECVASRIKCDQSEYKAKDLRDNLTREDIVELFELEILSVRKSDLEGWAKLNAMDISDLLTITGSYDRVNVS